MSPCNAIYRKSKMANPWLKKNPFMSLWLSAANRVAATVRGQATAQARRQVKAATVEAISPPAPKVASKTSASAKANASTKARTRRKR